MSTPRYVQGSHCEPWTRDPPFGLPVLSSRLLESRVSRWHDGHFHRRGRAAFAPAGYLRRLEYLTSAGAARSNVTPKNRRIEEGTDRAMATILVVDERPLNSHFVAALLRDHRHRALEASSGDDVLDIIRKEHPDLVLIDILMPDIDVGRFLLDMREERDLIQPRFVFRAPACIEAEGRALAQALGATFLAKPDSPDVLLAVVDGVLAQPRLPPGGAHPQPKAIESLWRAAVRGLCQQGAKLEKRNARLERRVIECSEQIEAARAAMDEEIKKRLWGEQELTQANLRLRDLAVRDVLTGLYNRRYLEESLDREESRARRSGQPLGLMLLDVDRLKHCNDTLGHAAGDSVLRAIAQHMNSLARGEDIVCRYGGDEFLMVMAQASLNALQERAEKVRLGVQDLEIEYGGRRIEGLTLSVGIGIFPDHGESGRAVLRAADIALYRAKQAGRDRVVMGEKLQA
jgi:diguanylate cyclase (GGDEF)-like protein